MNDSLGELLRRTADAVSEPRLDVDELVAGADRRQRHRRRAVAAATAGVVGAIVVGSFVVRGGQPRDLEPAPSPSPSPPSTVAVDPNTTRPVVYAEGSTVHIGDKTVEAQDPVAFIDATDDGVVFEAALDCELWFTDGTTTSVIGSSAWTAAPTAHLGNVVTGDSGSLVVWRDVTSCKDQRTHGFVVYDTARREVVGRIPLEDNDGSLLYVDEDQVYFSPQLSPGCWVHDIHTCHDPHLFRFDVPSGRTTKITLAELDAELSNRARIFVSSLPELIEYYSHFRPGASFRQVGSRLAYAYPAALRTTSGDEIRLRLPDGWTAPGPSPEPEGFPGRIQVSQWLDDDHIVVFANDGGGDLPAKEGDLLVCRLPDGGCRVAVPRSSRPYVTPWRPTE